MSKPDIPLELMDQAANWVVLLSSDDSEEAVQAAKDFQVWQAQSSLHQSAADEMQRLVSGVREISESRAASTAINRSLESSSNWPVKSIATVLAVFCFSYFIWWSLPNNSFASLMADFKTNRTEWQTFPLPDSSQLKLAGASYLDMHYSQKERRLELIAGEIWVDVAKDASRPFIIQTSEATIKALGTRFIVKRLGGQTRVQMLESKVVVENTANTHRPQVVVEGQQLVVSEQGLMSLTDINAKQVEQSWQGQQLVVDNLPLVAVLEQLKPYQTGWLYYDADQLADISVSAVLPLNDPDAALDLLQAGLSDVEVTQVSPWVKYIKLSE